MRRSNVIWFFLFFTTKALAEPTPLSFSPEWLRLVHYQGHLLGYQSRVIGDKFFLHPDGRTNPALELQATIDGMKDPEVQCRFLARRDFLLRNNLILKDDVKRCEAAENWIKKLGADKVTLIFATAYMNSAGSSFGHTLLKFSNPKNQKAMELLDYGLNFSARTADTDGALYALKGLFGYFPANFALLPYHQLIKEYTNLEGRDIWEYELNLTETEIRRMIFHILELEQGYFDYYFLDENCSEKLLRLLEVARPELNLVKDNELYVIPIESVKHVLRQSDLVVQKKFRHSLLTEWEQRKNQLSVEERIQLHQVINSNASAADLNTKTLDAGLALLSWKKDNDKKFEFSKIRATREKNEFEVHPPSKSPDEGVDSSMFSIGAATLKSTLEGQLKFRYAFHDLLSSDLGASPWSELKVMDFDFRLGTNAYLKKLSVINILSTQAVDEFSFPRSWGIDIGAEKNPWLDSNQTSAFLNARWGLSIEPFSDLRVFTFLSTAVEENYLRRYIVGAGAELWLVYKNSEWANFKGRLQSLRMSDASLKNVFEFEVARQIWRQQEIRWQYLETKMSDKFEQRISTERIAQLAIYFQF